MPPQAPPITGLPFQSASVTVSPKPSLSDFCSTTVAERCRALIVRWASGGSIRTFRFGVVARPIEHLAEDLGPFRIVVGRSAGQRQLHFRVVGLQQAIRLDDAQRVLEPIEPRDLQQQRPLRVDAQPRKRLQPLRLGNGAVLVRQRIDRRQDQEHRARQRPREGGHREDRRVVVRDGRLQVFPDGAIRTRGVDVASPNPAGHLSRRRELRQVDRLRVVHEDDVRLQVQPLGVFPIDLVVQIEVALSAATPAGPATRCERPW